MSTQGVGKEVVRVEERDGKLIVTAPKGRMNPDVLAGLQEHKAEVMGFLSRFGGKAVVQEAGATDYLDEDWESWASWRANAINRLFKEQGATGRPGRITVATVAEAERRQRAVTATLLSHIEEPDKTDKSSVSGCDAATYACQFSAADPTSPDIPATKTDKSEPEDRLGEGE